MKGYFDTMDFTIPIVLGVSALLVLPAYILTFELHWKIRREKRAKNASGGKL